MAELASVAQHPAAANAGCVESLEGILAEARAGRVIGFAMVVQHHDHSYTTISRGHSDVRLLGQLEVMRHDLLHMIFMD